MLLPTWYDSFFIIRWGFCDSTFIWILFSSTKRESDNLWICGDVFQHLVSTTSIIFAEWDLKFLSVFFNVMLYRTLSLSYTSIPNLQSFFMDHSPVTQISINYFYLLYLDCDIWKSIITLIAFYWLNIFLSHPANKCLPSSKGLWLNISLHFSFFWGRLDSYFYHKYFSHW